MPPSVGADGREGAWEKKVKFRHNGGLACWESKTGVFLKINCESKFANESEEVKNIQGKPELRVSSCKLLQIDF